MKGSVYSRGEVEKPVGSRVHVKIPHDGGPAGKTRNVTAMLFSPGWTPRPTPPTDQHHLSLTHCTLPYFCIGRQSPIGRLFPIGLFPSDLFPTGLFPFGLFPTGLFPFGLFPTGLFPVWPIPDWPIPVWPIFDWPIPIWPIPDWPIPAWPISNSLY